MEYYAAIKNNELGLDLLTGGISMLFSENSKTWKNAYL